MCTGKVFNSNNMEIVEKQDGMDVFGTSKTSTLTL